MILTARNGAKWLNYRQIVSHPFYIFMNKLVPQASLTLWWCRFVCIVMYITWYILTPICGESTKIVFTGAPSCHTICFSFRLSTCRWTISFGLFWRHIFHAFGDPGLMLESFGVYLFWRIWRCLSLVYPISSIRSSPRFWGLTTKTYNELTDKCDRLPK